MDKTKPAGTTRKPQIRIRFPLGFKLVVIVTPIVMGSIAAVVLLMWLMVRSEFVQNNENINFVINNRAAAGIEERFYSIRSEALLLLDMTSAVEENPSGAVQIRNIFFERNPHIAAVIVPGVREITSQQFFRNNEISHDTLITWLAGETDSVNRARSNDPVIVNASPVFGINLLALFYPWQSTGSEDAVVVLFSPQNLLEITATGISSTLVVTGDGGILISQDFSQVLAGNSISNSSIIEAMEKDTGETVRLSYSEAGNRFLAAGRKLSSADVMVFTILDYSLITRQISEVSRSNLLISVAVMFLTILVTWFFSKSITNPLKKLIAAAEHIEVGEFDIELKPNSRDELGLLTERFNDMGKGLSKLEETRELAGRYNNQMVSRKFILKDSNLEGENLHAVVLYVNLLSFQLIAKEHNAKETLILLNRYISQVTECVERYDGIIDKIMGSRIIALWGVPGPNEDTAEDVMNSLHAALMMRSIISKLNARNTAGKAKYIMACGIHTGTVLAGNMGVSPYDVYTVTGAAVDAAVRCAEMCIPARTDIVISAAVRDLADNSILAKELTLPQQYHNEFSVYGLKNLVSDEEQKEPTRTGSK